MSVKENPEKFQKMAVVVAAGAEGKDMTAEAKGKEIVEEEEDKKKKGTERCPSLKVERNSLSDLKGPEIAAHAELKAKLAEAIASNTILTSSSSGNPEDKVCTLWGVPLNSNATAADVILLKFLHACEFKVKESLDMLKNTIRWRRDSKVDSILSDAYLASRFGGGFFMGEDLIDREGHPVCYNMCAAFNWAFASQEGREMFLRWRVQVMETGIQMLDLAAPGGVSKLLHVIDLKDSVSPMKKEVWHTVKHAFGLLQDNYPEFVTRTILINVPFRYRALYSLGSTFMTQRTKSQLVVSSSSNLTDTLLKYIPVGALPVQYGGFRRENDTDFSAEDGAISEITVDARSKGTIEFLCPWVVWDVIVVGWEVSYGEVFRVYGPQAECTGMCVTLRMAGKISSGFLQKPIRNAFTNIYPGRIILMVDNSASKKKREVLFRYKIKNPNS